MRWPWQTEQRDSSFTDTLIAQIVSQASGATLAKPAATGRVGSVCVNHRTMFRCGGCGGTAPLCCGFGAEHVVDDRSSVDPQWRSPLRYRGPR